MSKNTLVVNLFAGPGAGKSTTMAGLFARLKTQGVDCEMAPEFAKDLTWERRYETLGNQIYVFGKQHHRINRLIGKVDVVITDSPILLSYYYSSLSGKNECFNKLVLEEFNKLNSLNIFVNRVKGYNPNGRNQTAEQAEEISVALKDILDDLNIPYETINGNEAGIDRAYQLVAEKIGL